jgi:hypothetical protein
MAGNNGNAKCKRTIVQYRDRRLLGSFADLPLIERRHAELIAPFGSVTRSNTRLLALKRAGLLRRFYLGTGGSARRAIYAISPRGAQLVGIPYRRLARRDDEMLAVDLFAEHQLAINDIYCTLKHAPIPGGAFIRWITFREPIAPGVELIPDGYIEIAAAKSIAMFLEVDLGTEQLSVWQTKIRSYVSYAISGKFADRFSQPQFRTIVVTNSDSRLASLRRATATVTEKIFWFTTIAQIKQQEFWSAIWQRPSDGPPQRLL